MNLEYDENQTNYENSQIIKEEKEIRNEANEEISSSSSSDEQDEDESLKPSEILNDEGSDGVFDENMIVDLEDDEDVLNGSNDDELSGWNEEWLRNYRCLPGMILIISRTLQSHSPLDYFSLLFDDEIVHLLVSQTNLYAQNFFQTNPNKAKLSPYNYWKNCTSNKIKAFLAILIHMGIKRLPNMGLHWSEDILYSCNFCKSIMTRQDFYLILTFFHLFDNSAANVLDKLYKIRPFLAIILEKFQKSYTLHREIAIDEQIIPYTGRLKMKQYIKSKPTPWGIKVFILADAVSGYVWNFKIYTGSDSQRDSTFTVAKELVIGLGNRGHHLYFDSYYCSLPLIIELSTLSFGCVGTLDKRRKFVPRSIFEPRALLETVETLMKREGILLTILYRDKKDVRLAATIQGPEFTGTKSSALVAYTKFKSGVDKANQMITYYKNKHKSIKWWKRVFLSLLETTIQKYYCIDCHVNVCPANVLRFCIKVYIVSRNKSKNLI